MRLICYTRCSTAEQASDGVSLQAQREQVEAECDRRGWTLVGFEEDVQSGRSTRRRHGYARALEALMAGEADGMIAASASRLSRSVVDFGRLLDLAERHGFAVVALDLGCDTTTASGRLVANVLAAVGEWEARAIGERTRAALNVKRAQGVRLGRPPKLDPSLRVRIVEMRSRGMTLQRIADLLNREGTAGPHGGRWYPTSVRRVAGVAVPSDRRPRESQLRKPGR
jgi:DNA invertase Pin-like site-specific DNA recombinase